MLGKKNDYGSYQKLSVSLCSPFPQKKEKADKSYDHIPVDPLNQQLSSDLNQNQISAKVMSDEPTRLCHTKKT